MADGLRVFRLQVSLYALCVLVFTYSTSSHAQTQSGTGGLAGQVFCSDTQKAAPFASVHLVPDVTNPANDNHGLFDRRGSHSEWTATDGTFTLKDVQPGVYDVDVVMPGYLQPTTLLDQLRDGTDEATRQVYLRMLTRVTIQAGRIANATVTAYRGAELAGSINYDDGTPAIGIKVSLFMASALNRTDSGSSASRLRPVLNDDRGSETDDRGRFHVSGLADGTYTLRAVPRNNSMLPVYLGNTVDSSQATMITVKAGEERSGLDLQMDLTGLHHVRGVLATLEGHALPNATVGLRVNDGWGAELKAMTGIDGTFAFSTIPDGKFTVSVSSATDPDTHIAYKGASTQITVSGSDINDVVLTPTQ